MNIRITSPDEGATVRLTGYNGSYTLRTSFSPWTQKRFVDAIDGEYRLEHVGVMEDGTGIFDFRASREQQNTLIDDIGRIFSETYREPWVF